MSDLVRTIAAAFARKGVSRMKVNEFKHAVSLDLRWFSPAEARRVLMHAADVGLVTVVGEDVRPAFDVKSVRVPVDFRPTPTVLEERPAVPAGAAEGAPPPAPDAAPGDAADEPAPEPAEPGTAPPEAAADTLVERLIKDAAAATMEDPADVRRAVDEETARHAGVLDEEVAALVVARRHGVDVSGRAESVLEARAQGAP